MFLLFQRIRRDEEGQTLVLAGVAMLVLALCVMATINIGQATYEKIRLQNTADATAYSLAATQARVFNFFAYTNRAMITHYHSMLTFMAYLSYMLYIDHTIGRLLTVLQAVPYIGQVATIIKNILKWAVKIVDYLVVFAVPALGVLNYAYFLFQVGLATTLGTQLLSNPKVLSENDPDVTMNSGLGIAAKAANVYMLGKSVDWKQMAKLVKGHSDWNKVKTPGPEGNEGRIIMTELINNARHQWLTGTKKGTPIIGRVWKIKFSIPLLVLNFKVELRKDARTEAGMRTGGANNRHDQLYSVDSLKFKFKATFLGYGLTVKINYYAEVWADWLKGKHYERVIPDIDVHGSLIPKKIKKKIKKKGKKLAEKIMKPINKAINASGNKQKHHFYFGVTPFFKFRPEATYKSNFNQPEYIVVVSKESKKLEQVYQIKSGADWKTSGDRIENSRGKDSKIDFAVKDDGDGVLAKLAPGFNALSAARCYYHRPGEWREQPNFFNPFWGAKLVPIAHHELVQKVGVDKLLQPLNSVLSSAGLGELKTERLITH